MNSNTFEGAGSIAGLSLFGGRFQVTQNRLEYATTSWPDSSVLVMNEGENTAYSTNWTASLNLTNRAIPQDIGAYTLIGLQVFDVAQSSGVFQVGLLRGSNFNGIRYENGNASRGFYPLVGSTMQVQADTDVLVRISHNALTKDLTFGYSLDNGATYQFTYVFNPTNPADGGNWPTEPTNGYRFSIFALNDGGRSPVSSGQMYADNFSVTAGATTMVAVPEPSTYAAIAGAAAIGLAFWHRRRQARRAS